MDILSPQALAKLHAARVAPPVTPRAVAPVGPRNNVTTSDANTYGNSSVGYRTGCNNCLNQSTDLGNQNHR